VLGARSAVNPRGVARCSCARPPLRTTPPRVWPALAGHEGQPLKYTVALRAPERKSPPYSGEGGISAMTKVLVARVARPPSGGVAARRAERRARVGSGGPRRPPGAGRKGYLERAAVGGRPARGGPDWRRLQGTLGTRRRERRRDPRGSGAPITWRAVHRPVREG